MNTDDEQTIIAGIAARYRRNQRGYVRGKLRWDPVFAAAASLLADSPRALLDIGCGIGLLGQYLRAHGLQAPYHGLDLDDRKIDAARVAAAADMDFTTAASTDLPAFAGDVAMIDLLHYLTADQQRRTLEGAAARVAPDGVLLIRNVLRDRSWRFRVTRLEEQFARMIGWIRSPTRHFPDRAEVERPLASMGFAVRVEPLWGRTPFNSYLFVARR
ncbi:MAG TPA: methyltransferase domain-containing protein [Rhodanobacteraceae bacterium]